MSWRLLLFTLLLLAGIATLSGLYAGDWLIEHAPKQANVKIMSENDPAPAVAADGTPMLRQPAQPLVNGKLGIPESMVMPILWQINRNNLANVKSYAPGNYDFFSTLPAISDTITTSSTSNIVSTRPIGSAPIQAVGVIPSQPIGVIPTRPIGATPTRSVGTAATKAPQNRPAVASGWTAEFGQKMKKCRRLSATKRGECLRRTRDLYCGDYNAWGQVADCPLN